MSLPRIKSQSSLPTLVPLNNYYYYANNLINLPAIFNNKEFDNIQVGTKGVYDLLSKANDMKLIINQFNIHLKNFNMVNLHQLDDLIDKYLVGKLQAVIEEILNYIHTQENWQQPQEQQENKIIQQQNKIIQQQNIIDINKSLEQSICNDKFLWDSFNFLHGQGTGTNVSDLLGVISNALSGQSIQLDVFKKFLTQMVDNKLLCTI